MIKCILIITLAINSSILPMDQSTDNSQKEIQINLDGLRCVYDGQTLRLLKSETVLVERSMVGIMVSAMATDLSLTDYPVWISYGAPIVQIVAGVLVAWITPNPWKSIV